MSPCPRCGALLAPEDRACLRCVAQTLGGDEDAVLGRYVLGEPLGRGGMGEVFAARDRARDVAVKFLSAPADPDARARLLREAQLLASVHHPGVVRVLDTGEDDGVPCVVLERVEGEPIDRGPPRSPEAVRRLGIELAEALAAVHARGIVHRDLKPENILLDAGGRARVVDFGLARAVTGPALTSADLVFGTPGFVAPERLAGAGPDPRQDVFSLSVLLRAELARGGGLAPTLLRALDRGAASDPEQRWPTMDALAEALRTTSADELPSEEKFWIWGGALLSTLAAALGFFAGLSALTPRIMWPGEVLPLVHLVSERLPDGRIVSLARFELAPTLLAVLTTAVAFGFLGLLKHHWRRAGLDVFTPDRPAPSARRAGLLGAGALGLWLVRRGLESVGIVGPSVYMPVLGGGFELIVLFAFFSGMLECWRTARPLSREPLLFGGLVLALVPPTYEFVSFLSDWAPPGS